MISRLEIENFYSIRDLQVLDLTLPRTTPDKPERFAPIFKGSEIRVPKVVAIFGANGSGKSTVLKALTFLIWFASDSFQNTALSLPCERFNDEESANRPIRIAIEFSGPTELRNSILEQANSGARVPLAIYRYELELKTKDGSVLSVNKEALRQKPDGIGKWIRVFERSPNKDLLGSKTFPLSGFSKIIDKIRDDASVISTLALFEHEASQILVDAARSISKNILVDRAEVSDAEVMKYLASHPDVVEALNKELQRIDVGIQNMQIAQTPSGPLPLFTHEGLLVDMPWSLESHGTRSFIRLFPWLLMSLSRGAIAVIDELDSNIHPLILPEILRWFYDPERNPRNSQLWMSCQSASLMDELTKEEIVLCEKDRLGRSTIYTLMDIKSIRRSDNIYKKYLSGAYGGVPHVG